MKLLKLHATSAANLKPRAKTLYSEAEPATATPKTYTEEELKAKADASFKAGLAKAKETAEAKQANKELEELRAFKREQEELQQSKAILKNLNDDKVKEIGLIGQERFAKEFKDRIADKTGDALIGEINKIKSEKGNELFFREARVNASKSLLQAAASDKEPAVEYYQGTTIRKR